MPNEVDAYIATFPEEVQAVLAQMRAVIKSAAPEAVEGMSYQMPTYRVNRALVHFAGWKGHVGFYPTSSGIAAFVPELEGYGVSKGAVQFPYGQPLPVELIRRMVQFRVEEDARQAKPGRKKAVKPAR